MKNNRWLQEHLKNLTINRQMYIDCKLSEHKPFNQSYLENLKILFHGSLTVFVLTLLKGLLMRKFKRNFIECYSTTLLFQNFKIVCKFFKNSQRIRRKTVEK